MGRPERRSIRLPGYDYSDSGVYFVTICTQNHWELFGRIVGVDPCVNPSVGADPCVCPKINLKMLLNNVGQMINRWWVRIPERFTPLEKVTDEVGTGKNIDADPVRNKFLDGVRERSSLTGFTDITLDAYKIMPNHLHGIIVIKPLSNGRTHGSVIGRTHGSAPTLGNIVQWFKTMTTNEYIRAVKNYQWQPFDGRLWQRNYYEHIIKDYEEWEKIREYIVKNPEKGEDDRNNPLNLSKPIIASSA
ncbi:MAG: transposase [Candidatus Doudnabacteria bacterium]